MCCFACARGAPSVPGRVAAPFEYVLSDVLATVLCAFQCSAPLSASARPRVVEMDTHRLSSKRDALRGTRVPVFHAHLPGLSAGIAFRVRPTQHVALGRCSGGTSAICRGRLQPPWRFHRGLVLNKSVQLLAQLLMRPLRTGTCLRHNVAFFGRRRRMQRQHYVVAKHDVRNSAVAAVRGQNQPRQTHLHLTMNPAMHLRLAHPQMRREKRWNPFK